jgi:hypothetical protein
MWGVQAVAGVAVEPTTDIEFVAVIYTASNALGANVLYLTAMAVKWPFIGQR